MSTRCPVTGRFNRFYLTDDGTLDTVVTCSECGREARYNFEPEMAEDGDEKAYEEFVQYAVTDAAEEHELDTEV